MIGVYQRRCSSLTVSVAVCEQITDCRCHTGSQFVHSQLSLFRSYLLQLACSTVDHHVPASNLSWQICAAASTSALVSPRLTADYQPWQICAAACTTALAGLVPSAANQSWQAQVLPLPVNSGKSERWHAGKRRQPFLARQSAYCCLHNGC